MSELINLSFQTESVIYLKNKDKRLAKLIDTIGEITYLPYQGDPYLFLLDTIIGQMLSKKVANCICERVHNLCNGKVSPYKISNLSIEQLRSVGVSYSKSEYILNLTSAVIDKKINFTELPSFNDETVLKKITSIRGLGNWSAKMYLIFVLNRPNILPYEDGAFLQSYSWLYKTDDIRPTSIKKRCKKWEPYSSIASRYLYKALDTGLTKDEFHLYR